MEEPTVAGGRLGCFRSPEPKGKWLRRSSGFQCKNQLGNFFRALQACAFLNHFRPAAQHSRSIGWDLHFKPAVKDVARWWNRLGEDSQRYHEDGWSRSSGQFDEFKKLLACPWASPVAKVVHRPVNIGFLWAGFDPVQHYCGLRSQRGIRISCHRVRSMSAWSSTEPTSRRARFRRARAVPVLILSMDAISGSV